MLDEKMVNQINAEQRHEQEEDRKLKNRILNMTDSTKKQEMWRKYFPIVLLPETDLVF